MSCESSNCHKTCIDVQTYYSRTLGEVQFARLGKSHQLDKNVCESQKKGKLLDGLENIFSVTTLCFPKQPNNVSLWLVLENAELVMLVGHLITYHEGKTFTRHSRNTEEMFCQLKDGQSVSKNDRRSDAYVCVRPARLDFVDSTAAWTLSFCSAWTFSFSSCETKNCFSLALRWRCRRLRRRYSAGV